MREEIAIGFVHPDTVGWRFCRSLLDSFLARTVDIIIEARSGPNTGVARNKIVQSFMDSSATWLLSVDADMTWTVGDIRALMRQVDSVEAPIVGALAFESEPEIRPVLYEFDKKHIQYNIHSYPEDLVQVGLAPVFFGLFHRSVFEKLEDPWFCYEYKDEPIADESTGFSFRLRDAGIPAYIDTRIKVGHLRLKEVSEADYPESERLGNKWWAPEEEG